METEQKFKFDSKEKYEAALVSLALVGDDDEYETLAEEYVKFMERNAE